MRQGLGEIREPQRLAAINVHNLNNMIMQQPYETPLWQLTVGEFRAIVTEVVEKRLSEAVGRITAQKNEEPEYVYGIQGLCQIFHCGSSKANRIKQSGKIDEAIIQDGRKIMIDKAKALELYKERTK